MTVCETTSRRDDDLRAAGQKGPQARFYRLGQREDRGWSRKSRHGPENEAGGDYLRPERKPRLDGRRSSVTPAPFLTRLSPALRCGGLSAASLSSPGLRDRGGGVCRWRACRQLSHRCRMKPRPAATAVCPSFRADLPTLKFLRRTPQARRKWLQARRARQTGFTATWPAFVAGLGPALVPGRRTPACRSGSRLSYGYVLPMFFRSPCRELVVLALTVELDGSILPRPKGHD